MLVMLNCHWFPSDIVTSSCWLCLIIIVAKSEGNQWQLSIANMTKWQGLREINDNFPKPALQSDKVWGKSIIISCHFVMRVMGNYHWFPSDLVTWSCWLCLIVIDFPQTLSLGHEMIISPRSSHNQHDQVTKSDGTQWLFPHGRPITTWPSDKVWVKSMIISHCKYAI
jgi:hypothetical protein